MNKIKIIISGILVSSLLSLSGSFQESLYPVFSHYPDVMLPKLEIMFLKNPKLLGPVLNRFSVQTKNNYLYIL